MKLHPVPTSSFHLRLFLTYVLHYVFRVKTLFDEMWCLLWVVVLLLSIAVVVVDSEGLDQSLVTWWAMII